MKNVWNITKFKNEDKLKYMKMLRNLIKKYKYEKYVKMPKYFVI